MGQLSVTGKSTLSIDADYVKLNISITNTNEDYKKAIEQSTAVYNELLAALAEGNFNTEDIENSGYRVNRKTRYVDNEEKFAGYEAYYNLTVYFDFTLDTLNEALNIVSSVDESVSFNLDFTVKNKKKYKEQLLDLAIQDAFNQAEFISDKANVTLVKIDKINYHKQDFPIARSTAMFAKTADSMAAYSPEAIELEDSVEIIWEISDNK